MTSLLCQFDGYVLRAPEPRDRAALEQWIASDPAHKDVFSPEHFMGQLEDGREDPRPTCCVLEDPEGRVMFIRISRMARVDIQFPPATTADQRGRIRDGLTRGMALLESVLAMAGCEGWIFDTDSPALRTMAKRRLGFRDAPNDLIRPIAPLEQSDSRIDVLQPQQQNPERVC
jgi:hypothetical protein